MMNQLGRPILQDEPLPDFNTDLSAIPRLAPSHARSDGRPKEAVEG